MDLNVTTGSSPLVTITNTLCPVLSDSFKAAAQLINSDVNLFFEWIFPAYIIGAILGPLTCFIFSTESKLHISTRIYYSGMGK